MWNKWFVFAVLILSLLLESAISANPTPRPSAAPTARPTAAPTAAPTARPTAAPTAAPTARPTASPTLAPTRPTASPTRSPTRPTASPTASPTAAPTASPTFSPTKPSPSPTISPTKPTASPTRLPTASTIAPTRPTASPTKRPTSMPVFAPTRTPVLSRPTPTPSSPPTFEPTATVNPTPLPSSRPSSFPSSQPSSLPSTQPTGQPTRQPSGQPTSHPTTNYRKPTGQPTRIPTGQPSRQPTRQPSSQPSVRPTSEPSSFKPIAPTLSPTRRPTGQPTGQPSSSPTPKPTRKPTPVPSVTPTPRPSVVPTPKPTKVPSLPPTMKPTMPTGQPSTNPSSKPTSQPSTLYPSSKPTGSPTTSAPSITRRPTSQPSAQPSARPSKQPSSRPTSSPSLSKMPSGQPSGQPTRKPTGQPSAQPTRKPSSQPTSKPSTPTGQPSGQPSRQPSSQPSRQPTRQPTGQPTRQPSAQPSSYPTHPTPVPTRKPTPVTKYPTGQPSAQPSRQPTGQPSSFPTAAPTKTNKPSGQPSGVPTGQPSSRPTLLDETSSPTGRYQFANVTGYVYFDPRDPDPCEEVEIQFHVYSLVTIEKGDVIRLNTPGLTSGPCTSPKNGKNVPIMELFNSSLVAAHYYEGNHTKNYVDSHIMITVMAEEGIQYDTPYVIYFDRSSGLKRSCSTNSTKWLIQTGFCTDGSCVIRNQAHITVFDTSGNSKMCRPYKTSLLLAPPLQRQPMSLNISFHLPYNLQQGDKLVVYLPGFTNRLTHYYANNTDRITYGTSKNFSSITANTSYSWNAWWFEGNRTTRYADARLELFPQGTLPDPWNTTLGSDLNRNFWLFVPRFPNMLSSVCGRTPTFHGFQYEIYTISGTLYTNRSTFDTINSIGSGCASMNNCNGHGYCDTCNNKCECAEGFGSASDIASAVSNDFLPDCSRRACPRAVSIFSVHHYAAAGFHRVMECSNNGVCDRSTGQCECFDGFTGGACEMMACPGQPMCSDRGICVSMKRLASMSNAFPLFRNDSDYSTYWHNGTLPWDEKFGHACVCDSSWPVGLDSNETQAAEFFGPACEFQHCPSGDNPATANIDETDCYGKNSSSVSGKGLSGNLCHVDCSNQGICDYSSGVCQCFPGYTGSNCGVKIKYL